MKHRDRAEAERDRGGDGGAEDEQEDDQQDRHRDQLASLRGADRVVLDRPGQGRGPRLGGFDRRMHLVFEHFVDDRHLVLDRRVGVDVEVGDDQGAARLGAEGSGRAAVPGRDRGHALLAAQGTDQAGALSVDRLRRAFEEDREDRRVAEVFAQRRVRLFGPGAGDVERAGAEPVLEAEAEGREDDNQDRGGGQGSARVPQRHRGTRLVARLGARTVVLPPAPPREHTCSLAPRPTERAKRRGRVC